MYPWHKSLTTWAQGTGLRIDALGLVTLLGAEEMDRRVGRLMPSHYLDHLPLLGAFTVASDRITEKKAGYNIYNISAGIVTGELAGWFSRWLQAQEFHKVRSQVKWEIVERPRRWNTFFAALLFLSLPIHGMLVALTVLAADWWGLANVLSMIISVIVRCVQVAQNQAGIDANIMMEMENVDKDLARYEEAKANFEKICRDGRLNDGLEVPIRPKDRDPVKVIVVTEDSKVVTIDAPGFLIKPAFTAHPQIPSPFFYLFCRIAGWIAFAVHVISIGMAALHVQICSVTLIIVATTLTAYKVGCEDSQIGNAVWSKIRGINNEDDRWSCWVTPRLKATVSSYPAEYTQWDPISKESKVPSTKDLAHATRGHGSGKVPQRTWSMPHLHKYREVLKNAVKIFLLGYT